MWGAREFDGRAWRTIKEAEKTEVKSCDRAFLASLLRRADGESRRQIDRRRPAKSPAQQSRLLNARSESEIARRLKNAEAATKKIAEFEEASAGMSFRDFMLGDAKAIGYRCAKAVSAVGVGKTYGGINSDPAHDAWHGRTP